MRYLFSVTLNENGIWNLAYKGTADTPEYIPFLLDFKTQDQAKQYAEKWVRAKFESKISPITNDFEVTY